jgi:FkbM family methyltransferase
MRGKILIPMIARQIRHGVSSLPAAISKHVRQTALDCWPVAFGAISRVNRMLPMSGPARDIFENLVFTRHWNRWYRVAYVPENRDRFFEHIVTFFYRYPIQKGDVVLEVGASSGEEAIRFARAVGPNGRLIAVEPEAGNLAKLKQCFPKDSFPQVTIVPKGAWKEKAELQFLTGGEKEHRLADLGAKELTFEWWGVTDHMQQERYSSAATVQVDTIDNIVAEAGIKSIDFVLFETNGAELEGVQGMDATLAITKRIAARGHVMRDGVPIYKEIESHLKSKGFETAVTSEGMVLAQRPVGWRMLLTTTGAPA